MTPKAKLCWNIDAGLLCNQQNFVIDFYLRQLNFCFFAVFCRNLRYYFKSHPIVWILSGTIVPQCNRKQNICSRLNAVVGIFCNHCQQSHILSHFRSLYISYFHIVIVESWYKLVHFVQKCLDSRSLKEDINTFLTIIWWNLHFIILHIMSI